MKKILFMILFCILGFVPKSFAFHDLPYSLPATPPGAIETFSNYIQFYDYQGYEYLIYCSSTNDATTYNTNNVVSGYYAPYYISFTNVSCNSSQYSYYQYNANTNAWYYNLWNSGSVFLDHTQPLADTVRTTVNLKNISGTLTLPSNFSAYGWSGSTTISQNQIIVPAGTNITHSVSVARSPEAGGGVASLSGEETQPNCEAEDGLLCGVCEYNYCTGNVPSNSTVKFGAFPNSGYAFAYWEWNGGSSSSTANPEMFTLSGDLGLVAVFKRSVKWPLNGSKEDRTILLGFGDNWTESCNGQVTKHAGIDIAATEGEAVYAAESGVVKVAQTDSYYGGWVTIEHDGSGSPYTTVYWHINYSVSTNDTVAKGDQIGTVLNYGHDSVVHLHFGLRNSAYSNTSNRGRLPQEICGGDPAFPENFLDPENFIYSY